MEAGGCTVLHGYQLSSTWIRHASMAFARTACPYCHHKHPLSGRCKLTACCWPRRHWRDGDSKRGTQHASAR
eukprot:365747-Chlamydomonas_euryale.AAC.59